MQNPNPGDIFKHIVFGYVCTVERLIREKPRGSQKTWRVLYRSGNYTHSMSLLGFFNTHRELEVEEKAELL